MSDQKPMHTPGPWDIPTLEGRLPLVREVKQPHGEASIYRAAVMSPAGHVCHLDFGYGRPSDEANTRLISAAPELLAFAKQMRERHQPYGDRQRCLSCGLDGNCCGTYLAADALIAKAEGR